MYQRSPHPLGLPPRPCLPQPSALATTSKPRKIRVWSYHYTFYIKSHTQTSTSSTNHLHLKIIGGRSLNFKMNKWPKVKMSLCFSALSIWSCSPVILGSLACGYGVIILLFVITIIYCNSESKQLPLVLNVHRPNAVYCVHF